MHGLLTVQIWLNGRLAEDHRAAYLRARSDFGTLGSSPQVAGTDICRLWCVYSVRGSRTLRRFGKLEQAHRGSGGFERCPVRTTVAAWAAGPMLTEPIVAPAASSRKPDGVDNRCDTWEDRLAAADGAASSGKEIP